MKITKRIWSVAFLLMIGMVALQAQRQPERPPMEPEKMAQRQTEKMTEHLSLDEKQAEKVAAINLKYARQHQSEMEKGKAEREVRKAEHQKVHDAKMAELKQILTEEQYAKLEKDQDERKDNRRGRREGTPHKKGMGHDLSPEERAGVQTTKMVDHLGLNEKQATELRQVNLEFAKKREAMLQEHQSERQENHKAMHKLRAEQEKAIEKILTPEQLKQWQEIKPAPEHRRGGEKRKGDGRM